VTIYIYKCFAAFLSITAQTTVENHRFFLENTQQPKYTQNPE